MYMYFTCIYTLNALYALFATNVSRDLMNTILKTLFVRCFELCINKSTERILNDFHVDRKKEVRKY